MLRTHLSSHTLIFCLALMVASGACFSNGDSPDTPPADVGSAGRAGGDGDKPAAAGSEPAAGASSFAGAGEAGDSSGSTGATGSTGPVDSTPDETDHGDGATGGSASGGSGGVAGGASNGNAAVARGRALATTNLCTTCHQLDYSGLAIYPNITPDLDTGIGSWSDQEISDAIRKQKGKDNATLCNMMVPFPFTDAEVTDVVAFLRSLPAVSHEGGDVCPGHVP